MLDLTAAAGDHIEGTASWAGIGQPVPFVGWLALMRLLEDAQRRDGDAAELVALDAPLEGERWDTTATS